MRRVALIYNPASGQRQERRSSVIADVVDILQGAGIEVTVIATESPESAGIQAKQAVMSGCDTVIACGGDGTAHEVIQTLVGGDAILGVIPMGTANALATDLGLPSSPVRAAKKLLSATPKRVSVGRVFYRDLADRPRSRYFVVAAGVGVDGVFFSRLDSRLKQKLGYLMYLIEALRLWATHTFPFFRATFRRTHDSSPRSVEASQILAVRISDFGGLVRNLAPGAALGNENLHVIAFKTRSRLRYLRVMVAVWFQSHTYSDVVELVDCSAVECNDLEDSKVKSFVEADGELLGTLPVKIEVVPQSLTLLVPEKSPGRTPFA